MPRSTLSCMSLDRREFLAISSRFGLASTLFPGALYTLAAQAEAQTDGPSASANAAEPPKITPEMIDQAAALAGISIPAEDRQAMLDGLNEDRQGYVEIRKLHLPNSVAPAFVFDPLPPNVSVDSTRRPAVYSQAPATTDGSFEPRRPGFRLGDGAGLTWYGGARFPPPI